MSFIEHLDVLRGHLFKSAVAVAIVLLRRLQKARADLARTEADRAGLQAREAALPLARIRWRSGGSFTLDEKAAGLLNGRPDNIEALLALLAEPDRRVVNLGLVVDKSREACCAAQQKHEKAGGEWIEGAEVADAALIIYATRDVDDVMGGDASWFVDEQQTGYVAVVTVHGSSLQP